MSKLSPILGLVSSLPRATAKVPHSWRQALKKMKVDEGEGTVVSPLLYASAFLPGKWAEVVQV